MFGKVNRMVVNYQVNRILDIANKAFQKITKHLAVHLPPKGNET